MSSPESKQENIYLRINIAAIIGIIGVISYLVFLANTSVPVSPEYIATRQTHTMGTATAQTPDDVMYNTSGVLNTRDSIVKLGFESTVNDPSKRYIYCTGTELDAGTEDLDHNPESPEDNVATFLTAGHCLDHIKSDMEILVNGKVIQSEIVQQRAFTDISNKDDDYPTIIKARIVDSPENFEEIKTHDNDVSLAGGENLLGSTVISCGMDYAVTRSLPRSIDNQYCDYGTISSLSLGYLDIANFMPTLGHSGGPIMDLYGYINSVFVIVPDDPNSPTGKGAPLPSNAEEVSQEMSAFIH